MDGCERIQDGSKFQMKYIDIELHRDGTLPTRGECFVFGSNLAGRHGAGAARQALLEFGARYGVGLGRRGNSFAIPTKDENFKVLSLSRISDYVEVFLEYADQHSEEEFFLTAIGTGLSGYEHAEIAPMFSIPRKNISYPDCWSSFLIR